MRPQSSKATTNEISINATRRLRLVLQDNLLEKIFRDAFDPEKLSLYSAIDERFKQDLKKESRYETF